MPDRLTFYFWLLVRVFFSSLCLITFFRYTSDRPLFSSLFTEANRCKRSGFPMNNGAKFGGYWSPQALLREFDQVEVLITEQSLRVH